MDMATDMDMDISIIIAQKERKPGRWKKNMMTKETSIELADS